MSATLFGLMVQAAGYTVLLSTIAVLGGLLLGTIICAAQLSSIPLMRGIAALYVSFFRGVPLLVQLLLIYNALPLLGISVPSVVAAVLGLTLCCAAYQAENLRGGFESVPKGLLEAAEMTGMTPLQQFLRIQAPIAFRLTIPALTNEAILILKASSLVSVVGVVELTRMARNLAASTYDPILFYSVAGALYLVINIFVAGGGALAERMLRVGKA